MYPLNPKLQEEYQQVTDAALPKWEKSARLLNMRHANFAMDFQLDAFDKTTVYNGSQPVGSFINGEMAALFVLFMNWWPEIFQHLTETTDEDIVAVNLAGGDV